MAEIRPVINPVQIKDRTSSTPRQAQGDPFNITGDIASQITAVKQNTEGKSGADRQQGDLYLELSRQILKPIQEKTDIQASELKELLTATKMLGAAGEKIPQDILDKLFINPADLLKALVSRDKGQTTFNGEVFDILRMLANLNTGKGEGGAVQNAVVNVLRHFDSYVNQDNSLKAIQTKLAELQGRITSQDADVLAQYMNRLSELIKGIDGNAAGKNGSPYVELQNQLKATDVFQMDSAKINETLDFLKNQLIPLLSKIVNKYQQAPVVRDPIASIIHYVARYDKATPVKLNSAIEDLKNMLMENMSIAEKDALDLKNMLLNTAKDIRQEQRLAAMEKDFLASYGVTREENDILSLINKNLGDEQPARLQRLAFNLLNTMVDNQSPIMPILHYMIPIKWGEYDTFLEMYVNKEGAKEGEGGQNDNSEVNIFFTIQSDNHGTFEVDLLAKNKYIELDIKAPAELQKEVKSIRGKINDGLGELGYKLAGYKVGVYKKSKNIADKFPELKQQRVGIDIKI